MLSDYHRNRIYGIFADFKKKSRRSLARWACEKRILGPANPRPGKWSFDYTPYLREPHDKFNEPGVSVIVLKLASQMGKTETFNNICAYTIDESPAPMLMVFSKGELAEYYSKVRFSGMIDAMPSVKKKLVARRDKNTSTGEKMLKMFSGGFLIFGSSNSPSDVASWPVKIAIADEVDRFTKDVKGEGSAVELLSKRLSNFRDTKLLSEARPPMWTTA